MRSAQTLFVSLSVFAIAVGCKGTAVGSIAALGGDAIVDKHPAASVGVSVDADDHVRVAVDSPDGKALTKGATGTVVYKTAHGTSATLPLTPDAKTGLLVAEGPKLEALTELDYTLTVDAKPLSGTVYVPVGGTASLKAQAKGSGSASSGADAKRGPHGGVVQIVGDERIEIAATKGGEVRVYVLDAELHPIAIGARKIVLGVQAERPELVVLTPDASGRFFVGHWGVHADPFRITVREEIGGEARIVVVGAALGTVVVVGAAGPRVNVVVVERWDDEVDVHLAGKGGLKLHGDDDEDEKGKARLQVHVNGPNLKVKVK